MNGSNSNNFLPWAGETITLGILIYDFHPEDIFPSTEMVLFIFFNVIFWMSIRYLNKQ